MPDSADSLNPTGNNWQQVLLILLATASFSPLHSSSYILLQLSLLFLTGASLVAFMIDTDLV
jgi:hypothetical protein